IVHTNIDGTINGWVGNDVMEGTRAFFENLGFAYGNTLDAPWVGDGVPVLYFENERHSTPTIEAVESGVVFNGTTVFVADAHNISLYNMQGQLVVTTQGTTLDVSHVANGIYVVTAISTQGEQRTRKVVVR
ncbi:MAG: T9SS type A sorting domain-containing protein, partial [Muribaculaceae bacterium]|nr:T9SS type A sorting domain-containing protein [Muribaculaceae bacterium]